VKQKRWRYSLAQQNRFYKKAGLPVGMNIAAVETVNEPWMIKIPGFEDDSKDRTVQSYNEK